MNKLKMLLAVCVVVLLAACGSADEATTSQYSDKALEVVEQLMAEDFDAVVAQLDDTMKENVTAQQLAQLTPLIEQSGAIDKVKKQSVQEKDGMKIVVLVVDHTEEQRIYTITYDANDKIAGLYVK